MVSDENHSCFAANSFNNFIAMTSCFSKHMPSAIYKMKLHLHSDRHRTFICFCRTFGIRNIYDFILCTMHDAHPAGVVLNFCKGIHLHDIHCIATPQFHQSAAESIGNILRIKFCHHHFPALASSGIHNAG